MHDIPVSIYAVRNGMDFFVPDEQEKESDECGTDWS